MLDPLQPVFYLDAPGEEYIGKSKHKKESSRKSRQVKQRDHLYAPPPLDLYFGDPVHDHDTDNLQHQGHDQGQQAHWLPKEG